MKHTKNISSLLIFLAAYSTISVFAQPLSITKTDIDSLNLPFSLIELTEGLKNGLLQNDPEARQMIWNITKNYYSLKTGKKELELLSLEVSNLKAIWKLNQKLADKGDETDLHVLVSQNAYLSKKRTFLSKRTECRNYLLEIARLCNLKIEIEDITINEQEKKANSPTH